jgi:hypothetical protein
VDAVVRGSKRVWLLAAGAIAVVYLLEFSWGKALATPPEPYMSGLY